MVKAIIFDFDDTLSDRQGGVYNFVYNEFKKYFNDLDDIEYEGVVQDYMFADNHGVFDVHERVKLFKIKHPEVPDSFEKEFPTNLYDQIQNFTFLKKETLDVLKQLKGKYKLGVLTNGVSKTQHGKLSKCNIEDYFDEIVVSGDVGIRKPDKRIFEYAAEKLNVKCEECVFVGDVFTTDILGAYRAHMIPVWLTSDTYKAAFNYKGIRINKLTELIDVIKKL